MTTTEKYEEVDVILRPWQAACYWCSEVFVRVGVGGRPINGYNQYGEVPDRRKGVVHKNPFFEDKWFCCLEHKLQWIYAMQSEGMDLP